MDASGSVKDQAAPCGRTVDAEQFYDQDDEVVVTRGSTRAAAGPSSTSTTTGP